jgi:hypothetical protein
VRRAGRERPGAAADQDGGGEALRSAHDHYRYLFEGAEPPQVTFGGLVVEQYEHLPKIAVAPETTSLH